MSGTIPVQDKRPTHAPKYGSPQGESKKGGKDAALPFMAEDSYTDLILVVEGKRLYLNRSLLGYASTHFDRILTESKKKTTEETMELKIVGKVYQEFVDLLSVLHPAVGRELTDRTAMRLLPLVEEYKMASMKDKCEKVLLNSVKKLPMDYKPANSSSSPRKPTKDDPSDHLLRYMRAAEAGESKRLLDQCIRMFSESDVSLKELKTSTSVSDQVKAEIYQNRMESTSQQLIEVTSELEREKHENEMLKKHRAAAKGHKDSTCSMEDISKQPTPSKGGPTRKHRQYRPRASNAESNDIPRISVSMQK